MPVFSKYKYFFDINTDADNILVYEVLSQLECVEYGLENTAKMYNDNNNNPPYMVSCRHGCSQCKGTRCSHRTERPHPDPGQHVFLQCMRINKVLFKTKRSPFAVLS